jgi:flagellar M-ring protein FliF
MAQWLKQQWDSFQENYWGRWTSVERLTFVLVSVVFGLLLIGLMVAPMLVGGGGDYATLAANLQPEDFNDIVSYLNRNGIEYQALNNDTEIRVPRDALYRARFDIGSGIVLSGGKKGYRIFEEPRLGITDQYFQEQRIHAREVELERTLRAGSPMIENVFVHLNIPEKSLFKSEQRLPTATVKVIPRGTLERDNVEAIQTVVAFAVDGLSPERVQVVDKNMRILEGVQAGDPMRKLSDTQMQTTRQVEHELEQKARDVLTPVVPRSNVKVTATLQFNHRDSTKTTYDPETVVRSERTETESSTEAPPGGIPGTPANVPGAAVSSTGGSTSRRESEKSEVNYEVGSETVVSQERGYDIKRLSVAVLVDDTTQDLEALSTLVKNAVGYDPVRDGADGFTLASIPFDVREAMKTEAEAKDRRKWDLIVAASYAAVVLLVFLGMIAGVYFALRRRVRAHRLIVEQEMMLLKEKEKIPPKREMSLEELGLSEVGDISALPEEEQRKIKIRQKVQEFAKTRSEDFAKIIRTWINE